MILRTTLLAGLLFVAADTHAQFWKKKHKVEKTNPAVEQPTSLNPTSARAEEANMPKAARKSLKGPTYGLEQKYYERVEAVAKERRKAEKMMLKPQYSDPMYFGHKRPPKKRKASKMKYCKECGIRH